MPFRTRCFVYLIDVIICTVLDCTTENIFSYYGNQSDMNYFKNTKLTQNHILFCFTVLASMF